MSSVSLGNRDLIVCESTLYMGTATELFLDTKKTVVSGPQLGHMTNMHTLMLEGIGTTINLNESEELGEGWLSTIFSEWPKFHLLQHLYINAIYVSVV